MCNVIPDFGVGGFLHFPCSLFLENQQTSAWQSKCSTDLMLQDAQKENTGVKHFACHGSEVISISFSLH